jgi:hypothetical protein
MSLRDMTERTGVDLRQRIAAMTVAPIRRHFGVALQTIVAAVARHAMRSFKMPVTAP